MPSKSEQNISSPCEELLGVKGARVCDPRLLSSMHCRAHHVPGCKGGGHQTKKREGAVVLEGREQDCEQGYQTPDYSPSPALLRTLARNTGKGHTHVVAAFTLKGWSMFVIE